MSGHIECPCGSSRVRSWISGNGLTRQVHVECHECGKKATLLSKAGKITYQEEKV